VILPETAEEELTKPIEVHEVWEGRESGDYWWVGAFVRHCLANGENKCYGERVLFWGCEWPSDDRGRPGKEEDSWIQEGIRSAIRKNTECIHTVELRNLSGPDQDKFARMINRKNDIRYESLIRSISKYCKKVDSPANDLRK